MKHLKVLYDSPTADLIYAEDVFMLCLSGGIEDYGNGNSGGIFDGSEQYGNGDTDGWGF